MGINLCVGTSCGQEVELITIDLIRVNFKDTQSVNIL